MNTQEHYQSDLLFYFDGRPQELALYEDLFQAMSAAFPDACVKVQKSQISFYGRHLFAAASLPVRRKKGWPGALSHGDLRPGPPGEPFPYHRCHRALSQPLDPSCSSVRKTGD